MTKKEAYQALEEQLNDFLRYGNKIKISADFIYELLPILRQPDIVRCNQLQKDNRRENGREIFRLKRR